MVSKAGRGEQERTREVEVEGDVGPPLTLFSAEWLSADLRFVFVVGAITAITLLDNYHQSPFSIKINLHSTPPL